MHGAFLLLYLWSLTLARTVCQAYSVETAVRRGSRSGRTALLRHEGAARHRAGLSFPPETSHGQGSLDADEVQSVDQEGHGWEAASQQIEHASAEVNGSDANGTNGTNGTGQDGIVAGNLTDDVADEEPSSCIDEDDNRSEWKVAMKACMQNGTEMEDCMKELPKDPCHYETGKEWSAWFSDAHDGLSERRQLPISKLQCRGLHCRSLRAGFRDQLALVNTRLWWTRWFGGGRGEASSMACPAGSVVGQLQCRRACGSLRLGCGSAQYGSWAVDDGMTEEMAWFHTGSDHAGLSDCRPGFVLYGVECQGGGCARMKLRCKGFITLLPQSQNHSAALNLTDGAMDSNQSHDHSAALHLTGGAEDSNRSHNHPATLHLTDGAVDSNRLHNHPETLHLTDGAEDSNLSHNHSATASLIDGAAARISRM